MNATPWNVKRSHLGCSELLQRNSRGKWKPCFLHLAHIFPILSSDFSSPHPIKPPIPSCPASTQYNYCVPGTRLYFPFSPLYSSPCPVPSSGLLHKGPGIAGYLAPIHLPCLLTDGMQDHSGGQWVQLKGSPSQTLLQPEWPCNLFLIRSYDWRKHLQGIWGKFLLSSSNPCPPFPPVFLSFLSSFFSTFLLPSFPSLVHKCGLWVEELSWEHWATKAQTKGGEIGGGKETAGLGGWYRTLVTLELLQPPQVCQISIIRLYLVKALQLANVMSVLMQLIVISILLLLPGKPLAPYPTVNFWSPMIPSKCNKIPLPSRRPSIISQNQPPSLPESPRGCN